jgi:predicted phage terminase large subunit-like protein
MVGPVVWAAEFMNKPIDTGLYKLEWFHGYDRSILFLLPKNWVYFSGSDPSARDGEQADYKAHVVVALDQEAQKRYIAEAWIKKRIMADFFNAYIDLFMEYRMIQSAFEINGFQLFIQMELAKLCRDKGLWPNFKLVTHTQDKVARCGRWAGMVERADLLFDRSHSDQELLILQFNALGTKEHDDGPDAADMGLEGSMDWRGKFTFKSAGRREITGRGYRQRPSFSARRELLG